MIGWVLVGPLTSLEDHDVTRFDHGDVSLAVYRIGNDVYATDDFCTHERAHLSEGLLFDCVIECPKHNGRFDIRTGRALKAPARIALRTYPAKIDNGNVFVQIEK